MNLVENLHLCSLECLFPFLEFCMDYVLNFILFFLIDCKVLIIGFSLIKLNTCMFHRLIHFYKDFYFEPNLFSDILNHADIMTPVLSKQSALRAYPTLISNTDQLLLSIMDLALLTYWKISSYFLVRTNRRIFRKGLGGNFRGVLWRQLQELRWGLCFHGVTNGFLITWRRTLKSWISAFEFLTFLFIN